MSEWVTEWVGGYVCVCVWVRVCVCDFGAVYGFLMMKDGPSSQTTGLKALSSKPSASRHISLGV